MKNWHQEAIEMFKEDYSVSFIAEYLKVPYSAVQSMLRRRHLLHKDEQRATLVRCEEDCWLLLAAAVIDKANEEYKMALVHEEQGRITELEHFYRSTYGDMLSLGNGEEIIKRIRREVNSLWEE